MYMYSHMYNYVTGPEKTGLIYIKYTYIHIMVHITFPMSATQILQALLNSLGISAHMVKFVLEY